MSSRSSRRHLLTGMAAIAALAPLRPAFAMAPAGGTLHQADGPVTVNGRSASEGMSVAPGDVVAAGVDAQAMFTLGDDGFLLRSQGAVSVVDGPGGRLINLESGRLLSVFGPKVITLKTPHANVGIRGTAAYVEARPMVTNICVCYGQAVLIPNQAPERAEEVRTRHHDAPRRIFTPGHDPIMEPYMVVDHTDEELVMLEDLLGRVPPFMKK